MPNQFLEQAHRLESKMIKNLTELVGIPSWSPNGGNKEGLERAISYFEQRLTRLGFETPRRLPTEGNPILFAQRIIDPKLPTVLFYGHYDVTSVGKDEQWVTGDPFRLTRMSLHNEDRLVGKGSQDNKGQIEYNLSALEYLIEQKALGCNYKILLEGEEEMGSASLTKATTDPAFGELIKADILLVSDTSAPALNRIGICLGLRGIAVVVVTIDGPKLALHSGQYGGMGPNPIEEMGRVITSLRNPDRSFAIEGFTESVREASPEDVARILADSPSDAELLESTGWGNLDGEPGYAPQIRASTLRPALETTWIQSGKPDDNAIPPSAHLRIAGRLAHGQDPVTSLEQIKRHVRKVVPASIPVSFSKERSGPSLYLDAKDADIDLAAAVIADVTGQRAGYEYAGGSIPIIPALRESSGAKPLLIGAGLKKDGIHGQNESFAVPQLTLGFATICELLIRLTERGKIA